MPRFSKRSVCRLYHKPCPGHGGEARRHERGSDDTPVYYDVPLNSRWRGARTAWQHPAIAGRSKRAPVGDGREPEQPAKSGGRRLKRRPPVRGLANPGRWPGTPARSAAVQRAGNRRRNAQRRLGGAALRLDRHMRAAGPIPPPGGARVGRRRRSRWTAGADQRGPVLPLSPLLNYRPFPRHVQTAAASARFGRRGSRPRHENDGIRIAVGASESAPSTRWRP